MFLNESYIYINDLRFHAFHGVMPQERLTGNDYSVDLRVGYDVGAAMLSDDVGDTINYADMYDIVRQEMSVPSQLVERVAYRIAHRISSRYPDVTRMDVKVTKLNPPLGADCHGAGVELHLINDKTNGWF